MCVGGTRQVDITRRKGGNDGVEVDSWIFLSRRDISQILNCDAENICQCWFFFFFCNLVGLNSNLALKHNSGNSWLWEMFMWLSLHIAYQRLTLQQNLSTVMQNRLIKFYFNINNLSSFLLWLKGIKLYLFSCLKGHPNAHSPHNLISMISPPSVASLYSS